MSQLSLEGGPKETLKLRVNITSNSLALDERRINDMFVSNIGPPIKSKKKASIQKHH